MDSLRSSVSSPGIPKMYRTPSASRHSTKTSEAFLSAMSARYLTATRRPQACLGHLMRGLIGLGAVLATLAFATTALADGNFYIRGGGYGLGIGMSQYGCYGFALHGEDYSWILVHYY